MTDDPYWTDLARRIDDARMTIGDQPGTYYETYGRALAATLRTPPARLHPQVADAENAAGRWTDRAQAAEREASRLRDLLDITDTRRIRAVCDLTAGMTPSTGAKHHDDCWQRHAPCLAARIRSLLTDPLPAEEAPR